MTTSPASSGRSLDDSIAANVARVRDRLDELGRADVRIVAVTKTHSADTVSAALRAGLTHVGENYVNELVEKRDAVGATACWHFLGALQTNKIPLVARHADVVCSVWREREIRALLRQDRRVPVYVEVDYTNSPQRPGVVESELETLLECAATAGLEVRGLMTVAGQERGEARRSFSALVRAADRFGLAERSMGMSDDFEDAVELGSTEIRLGRTLFGPRPGAAAAGRLT